MQPKRRSENSWLPANPPQVATCTLCCIYGIEARAAAGGEGWGGAHCRSYRGPHTTTSMLMLMSEETIMRGSVQRDGRPVFPYWGRLSTCDTLGENLQKAIMLKRENGNGNNVIKTTV